MRCAYCNEAAETRDHVVPKNHSPHQGDGIDVTVPCCKECNSILGAAPIHTVGGRASFIRDKLARRYAKTLRLPDWSREELEELGSNLKLLIMQTEIVKKEIQLRLDYAEYVKELGPSIAEAWELSGD